MPDNQDQQQEAEPSAATSAHTPAGEGGQSSTDLITQLLMTEDGHVSISVVVNRLTKMIQLKPCRTATSAVELAQLFMDAVFKHEGCRVCSWRAGSAVHTALLDWHFQSGQDQAREMGHNNLATRMSTPSSCEVHVWCKQLLMIGTPLAVNTSKA